MVICGPDGTFWKLGHLWLGESIPAILQGVGSLLLLELGRELGGGGKHSSRWIFLVLCR